MRDSCTRISHQFVGQTGCFLRSVVLKTCVVGTRLGPTLMVCVFYVYAGFVAFSATSIYLVVLLIVCLRLKQKVQVRLGKRGLCAIQMKTFGQLMCTTNFGSCSSKCANKTRTVCLFVLP